MTLPELFELKDSMSFHGDVESYHYWLMDEDKDKKDGGKNKSYDEVDGNHPAMKDANSYLMFLKGKGYKDKM